MKNQHLRQILKETEMSAEIVGTKVGISGMTIRRWLLKSDDFEIGPTYETLFKAAICKMVADSEISPDTESAKWAHMDFYLVRKQTRLSSLEFLEALDDAQSGSRDEKIVVYLEQVGSNEKNRTEVDKKEKEIISFKSMGQQWSENITCLLNIVKSSDLRIVQKFLAYGALFYLILPFDFIPDSIPIIGYLDDFAVLSIASTYYMNLKNNKDIQSESLL